METVLARTKMLLHFQDAARKVGLESTKQVEINSNVESVEDVSNAEETVEQDLAGGVGDVETHGLQDEDGDEAVHDGEGVAGYVGVSELVDLGEHE